MCMSEGLLCSPLGNRIRLLKLVIHANWLPCEMNRSDIWIALNNTFKELKSSFVKFRGLVVRNRMSEVFTWPEIIKNELANRKRDTNSNLDLSDNLPEDLKNWDVMERMPSNHEKNKKIPNYLYPKIQIKCGMIVFLFQ